MELKRFEKTCFVLIEADIKSAFFFCGERSCFGDVINFKVLAILVSLTFKLKFVCYNQTIVFQVDWALIQTGFTQWEIDWPVFTFFLVIPWFSGTVIVVFFFSGTVIVIFMIGSFAIRAESQSIFRFFICVGLNHRDLFRLILKSCFVQFRQSDLSSRQRLGKSIVSKSASKS